MNWNLFYETPSADDWQGRGDTIQLINLTQSFSINNAHARCGLIGFCVDEGIQRNSGRAGAVEGPHAIRKALAKLTTPKENFCCSDAGNIICTDGNLEGAQSALGEAIAILLQHQITPIVLGGGHELAWGHYQGIAKHFSKERCGIVNFDAHFDLRPELPNQKGSSGTPFLQIAKAHAAKNRRVDYNCIGIQPAANISALYETAKSYHVHFIEASELHLDGLKSSAALIHRVIHENDIIYLSLCLDIFSAAHAPGVSAPQALGLTPWQVIPLLRQLIASGKVIGYDIAELSPPYDIDGHTAKLAASLVWEILRSSN